MELIAIIVLLGVFYWAAQGAYLLYRIISGFMVAIVAAILVMLGYKKLKERLFN